MGPQLPFSQELHAQKYRGEGESFREAMGRVAGALADNPSHFHEWREILLNMRFMPAGRVQAAMGATKRVTPYNCYVSGNIEDSFVEGDGSIMQRATEAAATLRMGGGIGYDFSGLRPADDLIKKLGSRASGPVSFMHIYDAVCKCVASAGHRRGAQMGVLRVDHPDIETFVHAKQNQTSLTGFNVSVAVTDEFMERVQDGKPFKLKFDGRDYREIDAQALWDTIMRSTWDWAEPGVLFIDQINRMNNLWYCEKIVATNPCGEQPLPPYGACLLGSFNLVKYLTRPAMGSEDSRHGFDWDQLRADVPHVVRAMDNVVDRAIYPLPAQELEAKNKRRMGLGVAGLANCIEAIGHPYGSPAFIAYEAMILNFIKNETYKASALLAQEKGAFPLCDERYGEGEFIQTLDEDVRDLIEEHGIRNSHLTSIAPTGTISLCADNISSGIEPVFSHFFPRKVLMNDGARVEWVEDYGFGQLGVLGRTADAPSKENVLKRLGDNGFSTPAAVEYWERTSTNVVTLDEHLAALLTAQGQVDSAVSKTCNVPGDISWEAFKQVYVSAWAGRAKGCTTFRTNGLRAGILNAKDNSDENEGKTCRIDPLTGRKECD